MEVVRRMTAVDSVPVAPDHLQQALTDLSLLGS